ncbi:hypothetical protein BDV95DRAFT_78690 [Massariosphaeria phaeospora]|uniref:Uncharacterized protein n=1 Tax=Massariosphaeria phaeospora TaxID=100035 RepID=A0A7C8I7Q5_9PLEO|nr:hypothetical protein BDV95DRAFT_78690 [Massariosphaeria phaeospora]
MGDSQIRTMAPINTTVSEPPMTMTTDTTTSTDIQPAASTPAMSTTTADPFRSLSSTFHHLLAIGPTTIFHPLFFKLYGPLILAQFLWAFFSYPSRFGAAILLPLNALLFTSAVAAALKTSMHQRSVLDLHNLRRATARILKEQDAVLAHYLAQNEARNAKMRELMANYERLVEHDKTTTQRRWVLQMDHALAYLATILANHEHATKVLTAQASPKPAGAKTKVRTYDLGKVVEEMRAGVRQTKKEMAAMERVKLGMEKGGEGVNIGALFAKEIEGLKMESGGVQEGQVGGSAGQWAAFEREAKRTTGQLRKHAQRMQREGILAVGIPGSEAKK